MVSAITGRSSEGQMHKVISDYLSVASGLPAYHSGFNSTALDSSESTAAFIRDIISSVNPVTGASDSSNSSFQKSFMETLIGIDGSGNLSGAAVDLVEKAKALLHEHSLPNQIDDVRSLLLAVDQALSSQTNANVGQFINTTA
jgi:Fe-S oxidoreductase